MMAFGPSRPRAFASHTVPALGAGLAAYYAPPEQAQGAAQGPQEPRPHIHHHRPPRTSTGLIVGIGAATLAAIILALGIMASMNSAPTLAELKAKLGIQPGTSEAGIKLDASEFIRRLGKPDTEQRDAQYIYFYYTIREGNAVIVLDRGGYEVGEARIKQIYIR